MRTSKILLLFCFIFAALAAHLALADESGECVANEAGECINPDAEVPQDAPAQEEVVAEPVDTTSEDTLEETEEAVADAQEADPAPEEEASPEEASEENPAEEEPPAEEEAQAAAEEVVEPAEEKVVVEEEAPEEIVTATDSAKADAQEEEEENTPGCPSRSHVIKCAAKYLDTNGNQFLERAELQAAIDKLPWLSRGILSILGSVDKMMSKCDVDGDDAIGLDYDMKNNGETCLATCFKRRAFKAAFFSDCEA
jgi:outer membrane biosynthesis protein TonB